MNVQRAHHWNMLMAFVILSQLYDMDGSDWISLAFAIAGVLTAICLYVERPR